MTYPHGPTNACSAVHCHSCNVDEPGTGYITCPECGHLYRTAGALRRAYRRSVWERRRWAREVLSLDGLGWAEVALRALTIRARDIHFCQECLHDF